MILLLIFCRDTLQISGIFFSNSILLCNKCGEHVVICYIMQLGDLVSRQCFPAYDEKPKYYIFGSHDNDMCLRHNQVTSCLTV